MKLKGLQTQLGLIILPLLVGAVDLSAVITTQHYAGTDNLPAVVFGHTLDNRDDLSPGYAAIFNDSHSEYSGSSNIEFARYVPDGGGDCIYWFGATDVPASYWDSYASTHWLGYGDSTLVDGAKAGSDNFIHLVNDGVSVGILQFSFDVTGETATLIAAAWDVGGLTFADGVSAIQVASVPEPTTWAGIFSLVVLFYVVKQRRRVVGQED